MNIFNKICGLWNMEYKSMKNYLKYQSMNIQDGILKCGIWNIKI